MTHTDGHAGLSITDEKTRAVSSEGSWVALRALFGAAPGLPPALGAQDRQALPARAIAVVICAVYVLALAYPVHLHIVGAFSDFYVRFAPDADRISARELPQNTYNPPGYPVLLVVASQLTRDHFTSGKWMSLLAAGLTGIMAFSLFRRLFGPAPALLAVPIILSSETFTRYSISAMTDVPFVCVAVGAMFAITAEQPGGWRSSVWGGVLCGAAYLIRYNGVFLLVPGLAGAISRDGTWTMRARPAAAYLASFLLTVAPWWWLNDAQHGSPFYSTSHEDVVRALVLQRDGPPFASLADVILTDPARFAWSYARHIGFTFFQTLGASLALLPVGPLAALGIALSLAEHRRRPVLLVLAAALSFLLVMSLTHWETRYFFFILVCYSGFAAFAIFEVARRIGHALGSPIASRVTVAALALWILVPSSVLVWRAAEKTLSRQPTELLPAARYLRSVAPPGATVMALRAQIAYLSHRQWRPLPGAESVDALRSVLCERPPDYLVYDRWGRRFTQQLMALADPVGSPPWLQPVYSDPSVAVYAVKLDRC